MAKKTILGIIEKMEVALTKAKAEAKNFEGEKEINAAGLRVRKALKEVKDYAQEGRKLVTEVKKNRKDSNSKKSKKK